MPIIIIHISHYTLLIYLFEVMYIVVVNGYSFVVLLVVRHNTHTEIERERVTFNLNLNLNVYK